MIKRLNQKQLLTTEMFQPSDPQLKIVGVFNPGAARLDDEIILLVRVAEGSRETKTDILISPRMTFRDDERHLLLEEFAITNQEDRRKPDLKNGFRRLSFISHLEIVRLTSDGYTVKSIEKHPALFPQMEWEEFGLEDARITQIDDTFYITYVAVSEQMSICTALMTTKDFKHFKRLGIIFDADTKDTILFPKKIHDRFACYTRPMNRIDFAQSSIVYATSPDLIDWGKYEHAYAGHMPWEENRVGAGTPPLETKEGWLTIYHGVEGKINAKRGAYSAGAFLAPHRDPASIQAVTPEPIFEPTSTFEEKGFTPDVIFPTGLIPDMSNKDLIHVYYGGADTDVAVATVSLDDILHALKPVKDR